MATRWRTRKPYRTPAQIAEERKANEASWKKKREAIDLAVARAKKAAGNGSGVHGGGSFLCSGCGEVKGLPEPGKTGAAGYGTYFAGDMVNPTVECYECCANRDRLDIASHDTWMGYLTMRPVQEWVVTNWPGTLQFKVRYMRTSQNNWGARVRHVWFKDHTGREWYGTQIGERGEIVRCRRLKLPEERAPKKKYPRKLYAIERVEERTGINLSAQSDRPFWVRLHVFATQKARTAWIAGDPANREERNPYAYLYTFRNHPTYGTPKWLRELTPHQAHGYQEAA